MDDSLGVLASAATALYPPSSLRSTGPPHTSASQSPAEAPPPIPASSQSAAAPAHAHIAFALPPELGSLAGLDAGQFDTSLLDAPADLAANPGFDADFLNGLAAGAAGHDAHLENDSLDENPSTLDALDARVAAALQYNAQYQGVLVRTMDDLSTAIHRARDLHVRGPVLPTGRVFLLSQQTASIRFSSAISITSSSTVPKWSLPLPTRRE
jgi:hypothetical protein